jgi:hypothetical protein
VDEERGRLARGFAMTTALAGEPPALHEGGLRKAPAAVWPVAQSQPHDTIPAQTIQQ